MAGNQARTDDDRVIEVQRLDCLFDLALHADVWKRRVGAGTGARDQHVRLDAILFCRFGELQIEVVFELVLVLKPAGVPAGGG